ncbi:DUF6338 family protein [Clostridium oceanicum]|uniref:DUF6338 family protein n=1 Tax=Clostridium oceanicum TaxID=1543 RepID=A0ABN1JA99_9CLOT
MDIFNLDKMILFIILFIPGFISVKVWKLMVACENTKFKDYIFETVAYSCINFGVMFFFIRKAANPNFQKNYPSLFYIIVLFTLVIMPIIWPLIFKKILGLEFFQGRIIQPIPKAWDYFFSKGECCYVLIHLKNSQLIGGLYGGNSFVSAFPYKQDIYLEEVWKIDENGNFLNKIEYTKGVIIDKDSFNYIEIFKPVNNEEE